MSTRKPRSLDLLQVIEKRLWGDQQKAFRRALVDICQTPEDAISASAEQREEALSIAMSAPTKGVSEG